MKKTKKKAEQKSVTQLFKIDAQGDIVYLLASSQEEAQRKFFEIRGEIPASLLTFSTVRHLPLGEEILG